MKQSQMKTIRLELDLIEAATLKLHRIAREQGVPPVSLSALMRYLLVKWLQSE